MAIQDKRTDTDDTHEVPIQILSPDTLGIHKETVDVIEPAPSGVDIALGVGGDNSKNITDGPKGDPDDVDSDDDEPLDDDDVDSADDADDSDVSTDDAPDDDVDPTSTSDDDPGIDYGGVATYMDSQGIVDLDGFETETPSDSPAYMEEVMEHTAKKRLEAYKSKFENPVSKQYLEYIEAGGDPARFIQTYSQTNYEAISDDQIKYNEQLQKALVIEEMKASGDDQETIDDMIAIYEERGVLEAQARRAKKRGIVRQKEDQKNIIENQKKEATKAQEAREQFVEGLKEDINKREEIGGFDLNPKAKAKFVDFMTKPDKQGHTELQKAASDTDKQLLMAYLYFIDFDFTTLEKKATTKATSDLRATLGNFTDSRTKAKGTSKAKSPAKSKGVDTNVLSGWLKG